CLYRRLAQQLLAARKSAEELVVEIVSIGQDHERGILHLRFENHAPGVEGHREALARSLRMPDDPHSPIAGSTARLFRRPVGTGRILPFIRTVSHASRAQCLLDRHIDGMELVIPGDFLRDHPAAEVFEDDEIPKEIEKTSLLEHTL